MMIGFILIYKDDSFDIKMEIYYQIIGVNTKNKCNKRHPSDKISGLLFQNWPNLIILESVTVENLLMMCEDGNVWQCHPSIASMSVNYKKQMIITDIKSGMQC